MSSLLYLDLETFNEVGIDVGVHRYAETVEITLFAYAIDDAPTQCWDLTTGEPMPADLQAAFADPSIKLMAHNAAFDRTVLEACGYHSDVGRWRCSMVMAYSHSLPGGLEKLGALFGLGEDQKKIADGRRLVLKFCKPAPKNMKVRRRTRETDPEDWAKFVDYAKRDIDAMRTLVKRMPRWNWTETEVALFHLDAKINARGFQIDVDLAQAAQRAIADAKRRLGDRTEELTGGALDSTTRRDALLTYLLDSHGLHMPDARGATIERVLEWTELSPVVHELLVTRLQASTTSTSKYKAVEKAVSSDGRLRGGLQFRGAGRTGRYAGRNFQPQNLPRPPVHLSKNDILVGIRAIKQGDADLVTDNVMELCSAALRGLLISAKGRKLVVADLSNIEGRMLAWLAGEAWKIAAFRAFDAKEGPDLYRLSYGRAFGVEPEDVDDDQRQIGKVMELALGYGGGVGAFATMAAGYGLDLDALSERLLATLPEELLAQAQEFWLWSVEQKRTRGFQQDTFVAIDALKRAWRRAHPKTVTFWKELDEALTLITEHPGRKAITVGRVAVGAVKRGSDTWLRIELPSGRFLSYPKPEIVNDQWTYMGVHQYTRKWSRLKSYGAKAVENITQAASADVMLHGMQLAEENDYPVVLSVHDELITEPEDDPGFTPAGLAGLMSTNPSWAQGLPLAAAGYEAYRYRK